MARLIIGSSLRKYFDRWSFVRKLLWGLEAGIFGLFLFIAGLLPADRATRVGRRILMWIGPRLDKHSKFTRNLSLAFPEKDAAEIDRLARAVWGSAGGLLAEYASLDRICVSESDQRLEVVTGLGEASGRSRPAIFVSAHLANWEVCAGGITKAGIPVTAVYTPLQNPYLERMLMRRRRALGCHLVPRDGSMRALLKELREGRSIGMIMDQRVDSGVPIPFFGMDKMTTLVPARLALRHGYDLIPVRTERLGDARFRVTLQAPLVPDDPAASEVEQAIQVTAKINRLFEDWIRERPEDWWCSKRRWPKDATPPSLRATSETQTPSTGREDGPPVTTQEIRPSR